MTKTQEIAIGMGATMSVGSDRYPATVVEIEMVKDVMYVTLQSDEYKRIDKNGFSESQEYEFNPDPNGSLYIVRLDKKGRWEQVYKNKETNRWNKYSHSSRFYIGDRDAYSDPSK